MFRHHQQLRRWAARVLLAWLFGLCAGVANACLPATGLVQLQESSRALPQHCHGDEGSTVKSNCADFCDKASVSIPPLKSALDDVQGHALQFPVVAIAHPAPAPVAVQPLAPRRQDGAWAPPIPIAFLRLAL